MPSISGFHTYLKLRKQRYFCKHCHATFTLKTSVVAKNCCISNNTKVAIALNTKDKISEKDIAIKHNVSHATVSRVTDSFYSYYQPNVHYLPQHLCFDEFKSKLERCPLFSAILKRGRWWISWRTEDYLSSKSISYGIPRRREMR
ncbi:transposase family protein [Ureibacillus thermosphaericus]|uniref:transposase family protein n=1 Tax=Ureibacillus thermosphaericus TaxID=51173 RepID=UPI001B353376